MVSIKEIQPKVTVEMDENTSDSEKSVSEENDEISHDESEDISIQNNESVSDESGIVDENESDSDNDEINSDNDQIDSDNDEMESENDQTDSDNDQMDSDNDQMDSDNDQTNSDNNEKDSDNDQIDSDNDQSDSNDDQEGTNVGEKDNLMIKNEGWADSLAKILKTNKPKKKKVLVLSRAKKDTEVKKEEKPSFEVDGANEVNEEKPEVKDIKVETTQVKLKRKLEHKNIRIKPNILEKDRERKLAKIATKGVVQLFNVVRNQQKDFQQKMEVAGNTENKKQKVLKSFDKKAFLDVLMGGSKSITVEEGKTELKDEPKPETQPKWSALRDDFMTGAKMKDWDKMTPEEAL